MPLRERKKTTIVVVIVGRSIEELYGQQYRKEAMNVQINTKK